MRLPHFAFLATFAIPSVSAAASTAIAQMSATRQLELGKVEVILPGHEFGALAGVAIAGDGAVYVLDALNFEILKVDRSGELVWRRGRKGEGPGEFKMPYRIAARPEGGVMVLDWGLGRMMVFGANGDVESTFRMPFPFSQFDALDVLRDGRLVVAGMTTWGGEAAEHSVHVFSDSLHYLFSFGNLAHADDTAAVRDVGSGGITLNADGSILLTLKRPYEIERFDSQGRMLEHLDVDAPLALGLDDILAVKTVGNRTLRSITPRSKDVEVPIPAHAIPEGGFIGGRATWEKTTLDLISPTGTLEASIRGPSGCVRIMAVDPANHILYCRVLRHDAPILQRVRYSVSPKGGA